VPSGSAVSLVSNTAKDITSISLTAGDWDISATVVYESNGPATAFEGGWVTTTNTLPTRGNGRGYFNITTVTTGQNQSFQITTSRLSTAGGATVFLDGQVTFASGSWSVYGSIHARRVR